MVRTSILQFKRNKLKKELNDRNLKIFKEIVEYIEMGTLSSIEREEVFQQVLDLMLQSQSEGKFVSEFIGDDVKEFCDSIIEGCSYNKNILHKWFNYVESLFQVGVIWFSIMFIISLIMNGGQLGVIQKDMDIFSIIELGIVYGVVFPLYFMIKRKSIFRKNKNKIDYSLVFLMISCYLVLRAGGTIKEKLPQFSSVYVISYGNIIFFITIFLIAFGRDMCYFIKNLIKKEG